MHCQYKNELRIANLVERDRDKKTGPSRCYCCRLQVFQRSQHALANVGLAIAKSGFERTCKKAFRLRHSAQLENLVFSCGGGFVPSRRNANTQFCSQAETILPKDPFVGIQVLIQPNSCPGCCCWVSVYPCGWACLPLTVPFDRNLFFLRIKIGLQTRKNICL